MSPISGVGDDDSKNELFNDVFNKPARPLPPQGPAAPPTPATTGSVPAVRPRRAPPPAAKRSSASSSAPRSSASTSSSTGLRKATSTQSSVPSRAPAPTGATKPSSYYLNKDANQGNRENFNPTATQNTFYPPDATGASNASVSYYNALPGTVSPDPSSMDWYTPSTMSTSTPTPSQPTIMNPYMPQPIGSMDALSSHTTDVAFVDGDATYTNEPPLMEELGINVQHIAWKTRAVVLPFSRWVVRMRNKNFHDDDAHPMLNPQAMAQDADLAGPVAFAVLLGAELLLAGKLQFGYIYGFGLFGCLSMTLILNLLQPQPEAARLATDPTLPTPTTSGISFWSVASILGYSLLPVNGLAAFKLLLVNNPFWKLHTFLRILAVITIAWSTIASTRLFEQGFGFRDQRYLIAYPIALLYSAFVLITIF